MATLLAQVAHIVVVDNASGVTDRMTLAELGSADPERVTLILNDDNRWLAAALNQGIEWAGNRDYTHVLFSSDTDLPGLNVVAKMLAVFADPAHGKVGSVNPRVVLGSDPPEDEPPSDPVDIEMLVTGGCLVSMEALRAVGPQREDFLVDMIDFDFGFRLRTAGYRTLELPSVAMAYQLGRTTKRRFLWTTCEVHNYSALRRYYFARNGFTLLREVGSSSLSHFYWSFLTKSVVKIVIYEDQKWAKLIMIARGIRDSIRGKLGHYGG